MGSLNSSESLNRPFFVTIDSLVTSQLVLVVYQCIILHDILFSSPMHCNVLSPLPLSSSLWPGISDAKYVAAGISSLGPDKNTLSLRVILSLNEILMLILINHITKEEDFVVFLILILNKVNRN